MAGETEINEKIKLSEQLQEEVTVGYRPVGWRDSIDQIVDAAVYRVGYDGPIVIAESGQ